MCQTGLYKMFDFFRRLYSLQQVRPEEEDMPAGKKARKKQRQRNKKRRQLLERSRRSRDDLINSALEETDVLAVLVPKNNISFCESVEPSIFSTPVRLEFITPGLDLIYLMYEKNSQNIAN